MSAQAAEAADLLAGQDDHGHNDHTDHDDHDHTDHDHTDHDHTDHDHTDHDHTDHDHGDHDDHGHDELVENNYMKIPNVKLAVWTFLGSECMFFGSLIATYFFYLDKSISGLLPREVFSIGITSISTFILLTSSFTMAMAVDSAKGGLMTKTRNWLIITALFGATFVGFQVYEFWHFVHEGLTLQSSLFGSTFYVMTGFHGAHVSVGVIWLLMVAKLVSNGKIPAKKAVFVESAGLYWHFVDIVWIIIFTFVYLLEFAK